jgi:hypothetical protein
MNIMKSGWAANLGLHVCEKLPASMSGRSARTFELCEGPDYLKWRIGYQGAQGEINVFVIPG